MASVDYPSGLPQRLWVTSYQQQPKSQVLRSQMEVGPPKQRRRYSAKYEPLDGYVVMDRSEVSTFETWWDDDLGGGALPFNWQRPLEETACEMQFREPYQIKPHRDSKIYFEVHMKLEILP